MASLRISLHLFHDSEQFRGIDVDFQEVPGGNLHEPVIAVVDKKAGIDAHFRLPPADYRNIQQTLERLVREVNPEKAEKALRKITAFLMLWR